MAARILACTVRMRPKLIRGDDLPADGWLPPVLPVVIYSGERRWSAVVEIGETIAAVGAALAPFQLCQRRLASLSRSTPTVIDTPRRIRRRLVPNQRQRRAQHVRVGAGARRILA